MPLVSRKSAILSLSLFSFAFLRRNSQGGARSARNARSRRRLALNRTPVSKTQINCEGEKREEDTQTLKIPAAACSMPCDTFRGVRSQSGKSITRRDGRINRGTALSENKAYERGVSARFPFARVRQNGENGETGVPTPASLQPRYLSRASACAADQRIHLFARLVITLLSRDNRRARVYVYMYIGIYFA